MRLHELRAQLTLQPDSTAAVGARYDVQLLVDGVEHGWYLRRLRGQYPQAEVLAATAQNLAAGYHTFSVQARLLDAGTLHIENTYITAQGASTSYPSVQDVVGPAINIQTTGMATLSDVVYFSTSVAVDLAVQGYFQVNSGTVGTQLEVSAGLDGFAQGPTEYVGIPPLLPDGINILTVLTNVPPGNHYISLLVSTSGYAANFSNRALEFVGFPATTYSAMTSAYALTTVASNTTQTQPRLEHNCGLWTKLLEATVPGDNVSGPYYNQMYEGYIHFPGAPADYTPSVTYSELSFETLFPDGGFTDGGGRTLEVPLTNGGTGQPYPDGAFLFGDTGSFAEPYTETVRLWARKVNTSCSPQNNGMQGAFNVSDRFFWVRHIPAGGGCLYP
jgi:hypothetical protein